MKDKLAGCRGAGKANLVNTRMAGNPWTKFIISAQGLYNARREELLGELHKLEPTVRGKWTVVRATLAAVVFVENKTNGRSYEGFTIMTFPVNKAGAILPVASSRGKFHGTMAATTPSGRYLVVTVCLSLSSMTSSGILIFAIPRIHSMAESVS